MRAIILAAGRGSRLPNFLSKKPKCFIKLNKKTLINYQIEGFRELGIKDISIITGYKKKLFESFGIKTFNNDDWKKSNMVYSLLKADSWLSKHDCIVSYGDIFYYSNEISKLVKSKKPISILFDKKWKKIWKKRFKNPLTDAETFKLKKNNMISEIGKKTNSYKNIQGQYMGIMKFTPMGWSHFKDVLKKKFDKNIKTMYLTDVFQMIIAIKGMKIQGIEYKSEWMEIDNLKDYRLLIKNFQKPL